MRDADRARAAPDLSVDLIEDPEGMMKRFLCASAVAIALTTTAGAADLPLKYPVKAVPMPAFTWTGFYVGGNAGYGWGDGSDDYSKRCTKKEWTWVWDPEQNQGQSVPICVESQLIAYNLSGGGSSAWGGRGGGSDPSGFVGGGQIGYNYQFGNNVVVGIEADIQGSDIGSSTNWSPVQAPGVFQRDTSLDYYGTIRARLGYAFDRFLPYITGGLAYGKIGYSESFIAADRSVPGSYYASDSSTKWGWTIGAGAEYAITDNWSIRAEYLYVSLGDMDYAFKVPSYNFPEYLSDSRFGSISGDFQTVRLGVNYRF